MGADQHRSGGLAAIGVGVTYGAHRVLADVSFTLRPGEVAAVVGPNGAGKSTLFRALCGLVPHDGEVRVAGRRCHHRARAAIAYLPQRADLDLGFPISVGQVVLSGRRRFLRTLRRPGAGHRQAAAAALGRVGLDGVAHRPLGELSGGQVQRVLLARALAAEAEVVLVDEAINGVDALGIERLVDLFHDVATGGSAVLVATHDLALARRRFPRILAVNGRLVADGAPREVLGTTVVDATYGSAALPAPA